MLNTRLLTSALLLLAAPLVAQDQSLAPDDDRETGTWEVGAASCGGAACNAAACDDEVDELPASPDGNIAATITNNAAMWFDFPTPSSNPSTSAAAQNFDITVSRCGDEAGANQCSPLTGGNDPSYDIAIMCGNVVKTTIATSVDVTGLDQNDSSNTWTFTSDGDCNADGSTVRVRIKNIRSAGAAADRRDVCIEAVAWDVTHVSAGGPAKDTWVIGKPRAQR